MNQVAIFVRIFNKNQDYHQQLADLRAIAHQQAMQVVVEIVGKARTDLRRQQRESLQQLLKLCRQGTIQKVLVQDAEHLFSTQVECLQLINELTQLGISIHTKLNTLRVETLENGKLNPVALGILYGAARFFSSARREELRERIIHGQNEARRQGKTTGRPLGTTEKPAAFLAKYPAVIQQLQQYTGVRETARSCGVSINTVSKVAKALLQSAFLLTPIPTSKR
jgi:DNA invertase Pin-like site-specific DNA recombinase